jgi:hypothetical protein
MGRRGHDADGDVPMRRRSVGRHVPRANEEREQLAADRALRTWEDEGGRIIVPPRNATRGSSKNGASALGGLSRKKRTTAQERSMMTMRQEPSGG